MTDEEIDAIEAGRELDMLVAEHVMGWIWCVQGHGHISRPGQYEWSRFLAPPAIAAAWRDIWNGKTETRIEDQVRFPMGFSTDIAAAWQVVEKMREQLWFFTLDDVWPAAWQQGVRSEWHVARFLNGATTIEGMALSDALAICRAALKCCKSVADKKEDAMKASPSIDPTAWRSWY